MLGIPKDRGGIKKAFIGDEGKLVLECDGSQMEIRVGGALANDPQMIIDFANDIDFHGEARNRLYGRGTSKANYTHQEVLDAKTGVFGPIYGRGAPSMARLLKCSISEAQHYIDKLWEPYPTTLHYLEAKEVEVQENGEIRSYYGRWRHWGLITDDNLMSVKHEARNFPVSSAASDTNLQIMLAAYREYDHDILLPLLPIHDSIVCSIRAEGAETIARDFKVFCERKAQQLLNTSMHFKYEASLGPNWGEQVDIK